MSKARELLDVIGEKKITDKVFGKAWSKYAHGVQVSIMDMSSIDKEVRAAVDGGQSLEDAIKDAVKKYRKN